MTDIVKLKEATVHDLSILLTDMSKYRWTEDNLNRRLDGVSTSELADLVDKVASVYEWLGLA